MQVLWGNDRKGRAHAFLLQSCRVHLEGSSNWLGWVKGFQAQFLALVEVKGILEGRNHIVLTVNILWQIWKSRNQVQFNGVRNCPERTANKVVHEWAEYNGVRVGEDKTEENGKRVRGKKRKIERRNGCASSLLCWILAVLYFWMEGEGDVEIDTAIERGNGKMQMRNWKRQKERQ